MTGTRRYGVQTTTARKKAGVAGPGAFASLTVRKDSSWRKVLAAYIAQKDVKPASKRTYSRMLSLFFEWVEGTGRSLDAMTDTDIVIYKDHLLDNGLAPNTVNLAIVTIRGFYDWAESKGAYPNIARGVKSAARGKKYKKLHLTEDQCHSLVTHFKKAGDERNYNIVNLMLRTGLRTVEVSRANIGSIQTIGGHHVLWVWGKGKDSEDNYVVLTDAVYKPLRRYIDARNGAVASDPLFVGEGHGSAGCRLSTRTIQYIIKTGLRKIGLDSHSYSAHSLRRTTGVQILKNGGSMFDVQDVLRHASPATSQIYIDAYNDEKRIKAAAERLLDRSFK